MKNKNSKEYCFTKIERRIIEEQSENKITWLKLQEGFTWDQESVLL